MVFSYSTFLLTSLTWLSNFTCISVLIPSWCISWLPKLKEPSPSLWICLSFLIVVNYTYHLTVSCTFVYEMLVCLPSGISASWEMEFCLSCSLLYIQGLKQGLALLKKYLLSKWISRTEKGLKIISQISGENQRVFLKIQLFINLVRKGVIFCI